MFNLLLDELPEFTPSGFKIRTDFRESIKFELLMQDHQIKEKQKIILALNLYYYEIPNDLNKAIDDILWFYVGNKEKMTSQDSNNEKQKQIYSYEFDNEYIYSAFLDQYGIDLNNSDLHWWKFKAMFKALKEDNKIVEIMGYRAMNLSKIKDKEEKARYKKLQKLYALPDMRTQEEKEADFGQAFW